MSAAVHQGGSWGQGRPRAADRPAAAGRGSARERLNWIRGEAQRTSSALVGHLMSLALVSAVFRSIDEEGPLAPWLSVCLATWALRLGLLLKLRGWRWDVRQAHAAELLGWDRANRRLMLAQGALTGIACAVFQPQASGFAQSILLIVVFTCTVAAVPALVRRPRHFLAYALITAGPMGLAIVSDFSQPDHLALLGAMVLLSGLVAWVFNSYRAIVVHAISQKGRADRLSRRLAEHANRAAQARAQAQKRDETKTQLMAAAGHDLRQPLLALNLYLLRLRQRLREQKDADVLDAMAVGLRAIETMVTDLLDLARCEAGVLLARPRMLRLEELYARLQPQVAALAFDRGLSLRWRGGQHEVWADPEMLESCVRNLVLNALHHTSEGGVLVAARRRGGHLLLQVWDSGVGMLPDQQARIFGGHERDDAARWAAAGGGRVSGAGPGCGLGLGIVQRLTRLLGATLGLSSRPGRGSVFELRLPLRPVGQPDAAPAEPARSDADSVQLGW